MLCAFRLLLQLLAAWTNAVKHIGVQLFKFLLEALKPNYNKEEVSCSTSVVFMLCPKPCQWVQCVVER